MNLASLLIVSCIAGGFSVTTGFNTSTIGLSEPHKIALKRESVPIRRQGTIVSFKTSYSGVISIGSPAREFRVVFDTGSAHVVIPATTCDSEACVGKQRYDVDDSSSGSAINVDGSQVPKGELCDQVDIGFGTGEVTGEFAEDSVCLGSGDLCTVMRVVMAVKMSAQPFKSFNFDGIIGLGLASLALSKEFSFFDVLSSRMGTNAAQFGVFLTDGEDGEESEIAFGGYDAARAMHELKWSNVARSTQGYWQVPIIAVRVDGVELDVCKDGTCRGVVDTGTSHLGIPTPHDKEVASMITRDAGDLLDCRLAQAPLIELQLEEINITLDAYNYMRRLPLREGVRVGTATTVSAPGGPNATNSTETVARHCSARIMPVNLAAPVGPKLFILGEPVLHRYYTVYDWHALRVGFALANSRANSGERSLAKGNGQLPDDVDKLLMQQRLEAREEAFDEVEATVFLQFAVALTRV